MGLLRDSLPSRAPFPPCVPNRSRAAPIASSRCWSSQKVQRLRLGAELVLMFPERLFRGCGPCQPVAAEAVPAEAVAAEPMAALRL